MSTFSIKTKADHIAQQIEQLDNESLTESPNMQEMYFDFG